MLGAIFKLFKKKPNLFKNSLSLSKADFSAVVLLVETAAMDGTIEEPELERMSALATKYLGILPKMARTAINEAVHNDRFAPSFHPFAQKARALPEAKKQRLLEMLWENALIDGKLHMFENAVIYQISEVLGVDNRMCQTALEKAKIEVEKNPYVKKEKTEDEQPQATDGDSPANTVDKNQAETVQDTKTD